MDKTLDYLGLAKRSGHLIGGTDAVIDAMRQGKCYLIVLALDASLNLSDKIKKKAYFYHVEVLEKYSSEVLNNKTGSKNLVYALDDAGFARAIKNEEMKEGK